MVDVQALGDDVADDHARVQGGLGVLEDHLHLAVQNACLLALRPVDVLAVEEHLARRGLVEPHQDPSRRGLAAPRLPHEAKGLAPVWIFSEMPSTALSVSRPTLKYFLRFLISSIGLPLPFGLCSVIGRP